MQVEFLKQEVPDHITVGDEILLWNCEEDMMNGPHKVAAIGEDSTITLIGIRQNEGTVSVIFTGDQE